MDTQRLLETSEFPPDKPPFLTACLYTCMSWLFPVVPRVAPSLKVRKGKAEWLALCKNDPTLGTAGKPPRLDITMAEVRLHNKRTDAWMVFNGAVYDVTRWMDYHPGGAELVMQVAGRDGHALIMKQHPWINISSILASCLVGRIAQDPLQIQAAEEVRARRLEREQSLSKQLQEMQMQDLISSSLCSTPRDGPLQQQQQDPQGRQPGELISLASCGSRGSRALSWPGDSPWEGTTSASGVVASSPRTGDLSPPPEPQQLHR